MLQILKKIVSEISRGGVSREILIMSKISDICFLTPSLSIQVIWFLIFHIIIVFVPHLFYFWFCPCYIYCMLLFFIKHKLFICLNIILELTTYQQDYKTPLKP